MPDQQRRKVRWDWVPSRVQSAVFVCPRCFGLVQLEHLGSHQEWHQEADDD